MTVPAPALLLPHPDHLPETLMALRAAVGGPGAPHPGTPKPRRSPRERCYDEFFGVIRSSGEPASVLAHALRTTLTIGCAWAEPHQRTAITRAARLAGLRLVPGLATGRSEDVEPLERWKTGHRLFFTLNQLAVVALRQARSGSCRFTGVVAAAHVLRAGAAVMALTAAFDEASYHRTVRPAMAPPGLPLEGFSGLWSADHRALIKELGVWGEHHARLCHPDCTARRALLAALGQAGAAHHGVCARFVGRRPSLAGSDDSLLVLERLHRARYRSAAGG
ncbi:hypothetical protein OG196_01300 [Kitasatospora purpeofusca]|uniref:hypothetical protein n=1 Tax=Kitasatospora purpeofusca TaxID=67352 RepID=UPI002E1361F5|nr:hypothetical protein OG715_00765 [Kitasatospora purpeofusca]WSR37832.1 hypothetical protein OG196_01300 [Kitasatospora purpeofusca]